MSINLDDFTIKPFIKQHLPYWEKWQKVKHVKDVWFQEGYEPPEKILDKIQGNGYDCPYVICYKNDPIGYIQGCDIDKYLTDFGEEKETVYKQSDGKNKFCIDLFIAEEEYLGIGVGSKIIDLFCDHLSKNYGCKTVLIDPEVSNISAIKCYQKVGFEHIRESVDHTGNNLLVMKKSLSK